MNLEKVLQKREITILIDSTDDRFEVGVTSQRTAILAMLFPTVNFANNSSITGLLPFNLCYISGFWDISLWHCGGIWANGRFAGCDTFNLKSANVLAGDAMLEQAQYVDMQFGPPSLHTSWNTQVPFSSASSAYLPFSWPTKLIQHSCSCGKLAIRKDLLCWKPTWTRSKVSSRNTSNLLVIPGDIPVKDFCSVVV